MIGKKYFGCPSQNFFFGKDFHFYKSICSIYFNRLIGLVGRVFVNGPGDLGSIPGRAIPKTLKMVLDTSLLSTQQYKVRQEGKVEQFLLHSHRVKNMQWYIVLSI